MAKVNKDILLAPGASWVTDLQNRVGNALGARVVGITSTCLTDDNLLSVEGIAESTLGERFKFCITGAFDKDLQPPAAIPDPEAEPQQYLFPLGTEFSAQEPSQSFATVDDLWAAISSTVPVLIEPQLKGMQGILEKKGGEAHLWFTDFRGIDQLSKYPDLKQFVIDIDGDFVLETTTWIDAAGAPLPGQEVVLEGSTNDLGEGNKLAITLTDILYLNEDIHEQPADLRYATMEKFFNDVLSQQPEFRIIPVQTAADQFQLATSVQWARDFVGSMGVNIKVASAPYALTGTSDSTFNVTKQDPPTIMGIYKSMPDQRIIYCVVLRPNFLDAQDDLMSPEDVQAAAHDYLENARVIGLRHGNDPTYGANPVPGAVLESYIAPADFSLGDGEVKAGDWVIAMRIDDQGIWDKIVNGEYQGVSVGGVGEYEPLT